MQGVGSDEEAHAPVMALEKLLQGNGGFSRKRLGLVEMSETSAAQALALRDAFDLDGRAEPRWRGAGARPSAGGGERGERGAAVHAHGAGPQGGRVQFGAVTQGAIGGWASPRCSRRFRLLASEPLRGGCHAAPHRVLQADITSLDVDAIVNAANARCWAAAGVDGAIHRAAGPRAARGMPDARGLRDRRGQDHARLSAEGPACHPYRRANLAGRQRHEEQLLASAYASSLTLADAHGLRSIAFPAISTGVYGFPPDRPAQIAIATVAGYLRASPHLSRVIFCCFRPGIGSPARARLACGARLSKRAAAEIMALEIRTGDRWSG
jgi:O-acetyl-ADP-ribose deacetylase (regulator of RNase III)